MPVQHRARRAAVRGDGGPGAGTAAGPSQPAQPVVPRPRHHQRPGSDGITTRARRTGYLACALALLWSLPHFLMAARIPGFGATAQAVSDLAPDAGRDLTEIAVGTIGLCAGLLALALVQPWGRVFPRWLLALPAWAGAAVTAGYGYVNIVIQVLYDTRTITPAPLHATVASGWWYYWYILFAALGTALAATAWLTRPATPQRGPGNR